MEYRAPIQKGDGWWFTRILSDSTEIWFGPYPDEENCHQNLERLRRSDLNTSKGQQYNLFNSPSWQSVVQDIFGTLPSR